MAKDEMFIVNVIDSKKWDKARWSAVAFMHDPTGERIPMMGIVFTDLAVGRQIFQDWIRAFGSVDQHEELRVAIIEGDIPGHAPGYSVHIGSNPENTARRLRLAGHNVDAPLVLTVGRIHRMHPEPGSPHLPRFKQEFAKHCRYYLIPVSPKLEPIFDLCIGKTEVHFRNVADLGPDDVDRVIFDDPDPGSSVMH